MPENPQFRQNELDDIKLKVSPDADLAEPSRDVLSAVIGGKYQIVSKLGDGGMSSVYKAKDLVLDRFVALKLLAENRVLDEASLRRFQQEARAIGRLDDPRLVKVFELAADCDRPYIAMELIEGTPLSDLLRQQTTLPLDRCISIFSQLCEGLQHAHEHNVIHRDLKPSNVMITGGATLKDSIKIVDFGIAKLMANDETLPVQALTQTGEIFGSPLYMSPEQCLGHTIDHRTDQYSLGCMLYECLTGMPPHVGNTSIETLIKHQTAQAASLKEGSLGLDFPLSLEQIVKRLLEKDPAQRYASMEEVKRALATIWDTKSGGSAPAVPSIQRKNYQLVFVCLLGVLIAAAAVFAILFSVYNEPPQSIAPSQPITIVDLPGSPAVENATLHKKANQTFFAQVKKHLGAPEVTVPTDVSDAGLEALTDMPNLRKLDMHDCSYISTQGWKSIEHLPLEDLNVATSQIEDSAMESIAKLTKLKCLNLTQTNISEVGLSKLVQLPIEELNLTTDISINDASVARISAFKNLKVLKLKNTKITDRGLQHLIGSGALKNLKNLSLIGTPISNSGLKTISELDNLYELDLTEDAIGDEGIKYMKGMNLEFIGLAQTRISDRSIDELLTMPKLIRVNLAQTTITDAALRKLSRHKILQLLDISGCTNLSTSAIEQFHKDLPQCRLEQHEPTNVERIRQMIHVGSSKP